MSEKNMGGKPSRKSLIILLVLGLVFWLLGWLGSTGADRSEAGFWIMLLYWAAAPVAGIAALVLAVRKKYMPAAVLSAVSGVIGLVTGILSLCSASAILPAGDPSKWQELMNRVYYLTSASCILSAALFAAAAFLASRWAKEREEN